MERLMFPINSYNPKFDAGGTMHGSLLEKFVPTAMICTMGAQEQMTVDNHFPETFGQNARFFESRFGYTESLCTYQSCQFSDYSR